ncbi:MAG: hypothetical protein ACRDT0_27210 [Pseudonocardiaceae bacterium]
MTATRHYAATLIFNGTPEAQGWESGGFGYLEQMGSVVVRRVAVQLMDHGPLQLTQPPCT